MQPSHADIGALTIAALALTVSVLSLYVSRVVLPTKMKSAYRKSITVLAAAVETKDFGTVGHAQHVAELTRAVALRLGIQGKPLEQIEYAALLRDIGKANVPSAILNKTEPLTEQEWEILKEHAVLGAQMVAAVPFLAGSAELIAHHHESWDGTGYPDGLAREQIPLGSRILAATSDYDAMVSERPYHPVPLSTDQAVEEIQAGRGVKYDPVVVDAFMELVGEGALAKSRAA